SRAVGVSIRDLNVPEDVVIAAVLRDGKLVTPRGGTVFRAGDHVYLISSSSETVSVPASFRAPARTAAVAAEAKAAQAATVTGDASERRAANGVEDAPEAGAAGREP